VAEPSPFPRATRFRSNATACGIFAANAVSPSDRYLLLRMQRSWLERAHHEGWIKWPASRIPGRLKGTCGAAKSRAVLIKAIAGE
jgi:hypothetical protein